MLKVGIIEYLNTIPVYYGFLKGTVDTTGIEFVEDVPSELNELLREGFLDISVISSYEYLSNSDKYLLFPDFSISAKRKVLSVLFLSTMPIHQLHRKDVWLTRSSMTSRELLKYLLKNVYGIEPNYYYYSLKDNDLPKNPTALLTIGDDAFKLSKNKKFTFIYDLAEEWFNIHGLPFVFAVWAVRKDVFEKRPDEVRSFYKKLLESRAEGIKNLKKICTTYSPKLSIKCEDCMEYLENLRFNLGEDEKKSLQLFAQSIGVPSKLEFIQ